MPPITPPAAGVLYQAALQSNLATSTWLSRCSFCPRFCSKGDPGSTHTFTQHHSSYQNRDSFPITLSPETCCLILPAASADVSFDTECKVSTLTCTELLCLRGLQVRIHKYHKSTNPTHGAAQNSSLGRSWALTSLFQCHQHAQWL